MIDRNIPDTRTLYVGVRLNLAERDRVDQAVERLKAKMGGLKVSRSDIFRILLNEHLPAASAGAAKSEAK